MRPNLTFNIGLRYDYFCTSQREIRPSEQPHLGIGPGSFGNRKPQDRRANFTLPTRTTLHRAWALPGNTFKIHKQVGYPRGFGVAYNRIADTTSAITRVNPPFLSARVRAAR